MNFLFRQSEFWLTLLLLGLLALFMSNGPAFRGWPMYESLLSTLPLFGFLALGLTLVVTAGEMDLCFPATTAAAGFCYALAADSLGSPLSGMLAALISGTVIGAGNGLLIGYVGAPSIIITIGTQFFWRGVVTLLSGGLALSLADISSSPGLSLFVGRTGHIPMQALWLLFTAFALWLLLNRHPAGDDIRFTGENQDIALRLGVNVRRTKFFVHTLMGTTAGFAGAVGCMEMGSWWPTQGDGYMLLVFAAVFIGGTSVLGGVGRICGTLIGIAVIGIIEAGIVSSGFSGFWTRTIHGLVIVTAVSAHTLLSSPLRSPKKLFSRQAD